MNLPAAPAPANVVAKQEPKNIRELLLNDSYKASLAAALPKHITADRMVRVVLTAINRNPKLLECTKESLWQSIMDCASLGLEPDALGRAYLVPYSNKAKDANGVERWLMQAQLQIGFKGFADLAYRSGMIDTLQAQVVYERDHFILEFGSAEKLEHKPAPGDRGKAVGVYAYCRMKGGAFKSDYMTVADVERIRQRSKSKDRGPWVTDFDEMAKKTVFKRLSKYLPLSSEIRDAVDRDNAADFDLSNATATAGERLADDFGGAKAGANPAEDADAANAKPAEVAGGEVAQ